MVFNSKKDLWLMVLIWSAALVPLAIGIYILVFPSGSKTTSIDVAIAGMSSLLIFLFISPLHYQITSSELLIRSGILRWTIPLSSIEEVFPSRSPLSGPALSLDRVQINYKINGAKKSILVSPENKTLFLQRLTETAPHLKYHDGKLQ